MKATEQVPSGSSNVHKVTSPPQNSKEACYRCGLTTSLMIVVSRRPRVTVVVKRDTSNEPVRVADNLKGEGGMHLLQEEGRGQNG